MPAQMASDDTNLTSFVELPSAVPCAHAILLSEIPDSPSAWPPLPPFKPRVSTCGKVSFVTHSLTQSSLIAVPEVV